MMRRKTVGWTRALILLGIMSAVAIVSVPRAEQATNVVKFVPAATGKVTKSGNCWTSSIAISRPDAWRCMVGNSISDPCFTLPGEKTVVCDPNPAKGDPGFILKLTETLPKSEAADPAEKPVKGGWLVELADGTLCHPITGAGGLVGGKPLSYYCSDNQDGASTALLGEFNTKKPTWTAEKATISQGSRGPKLLKSMTVGIKTVWQ